MRKSPGLMTIGIALIMLIFSLITAMVITNISSNLYKNIIKMDVRKESQYKRVVILSLKNAMDYSHGLNTINGKDRQDYYDDLTEASQTWSREFKFILSEDLSPTNEALSIDFPASVTLAATNVETSTQEATKLNFFELYTKPDLINFDYDEDIYGIVVQYPTK